MCASQFWIAEAMIIALLFNSDDPKYDCSYGDPIRAAVLGTGIVQVSGRHMKMALGDVLIFSSSRTWDAYDRLTERAYFGGEWALLHEDRLRATFRTATVYSLIFENMPEALARQLHEALTSDPAYLGLLAVDYTYGPHLVLFRNSMIPKYRLNGTTCRIFESMGSSEDRDEYEAEELRQLGFTDVDWEDRGAHGTIFDDFDTPEHFAQVAAFRKTITPFVRGGEDAAYELVMVLEDLNPRLFNALGAAVASLEAARHEEHVAQAAVSGRRYLEKLADVLFPPRDTPSGTRPLGKDKFRNRLWAYIEEHATSPAMLKGLGEEVDRLNGEFSAAIHSDIARDRIMRALVAAAELTNAILALDATAARQPYFAHQERLQNFLKDVVRDSFGDDPGKPPD